MNENRQEWNTDLRQNTETKILSSHRCCSVFFKILVVISFSVYSNLNITFFK